MGFPGADISVLLQDYRGTRDFTRHKDTRAPEGTTTGALVGMGMPEYEAKRYEGHLKAGGVLLSVHCDTSSEIDLAKDVLKQTGAEDVASSGESSQGVESGKTRTSSSY